MSTDTESLTVTVEEPAAWSRVLSIIVPAERVAKTRRAISRQIAERAKLPGFRKGKMPAGVLEQRFGPAIDQETLDRMIQEAYREALEREDLSPISEAEVDNVVYQPKEDLRFDVRFDIRPDPKIERVEGFTVKRPPTEIGDDDVDSVLERLRNEQGTWHPLPAGETPDYEDRVTVEITELDGSEGQEAEAEQFRFVIGEGQAIPDVEEAITTLEPGSEGEFRPKFPDDFPDESQRGKEQHLRIRLVEAHRKELPELDDEFASSVGEFESIGALRERIETDLKKDAEERAEASVRDQLVERIVEANPFDVPESMVDRYLRLMLTGGRDEKPTPEQEARFTEMKPQLRPQAERSLRRMMVVEKLGEREDLRITPEDVDARVEEMAEQYGREPGEVWIQLEKSGQLQSLENEIREDKVFDFLKSVNTVE